MKNLTLNSGVEINIDALTTTDRERLTAALADKRGRYVPEKGERCLVVEIDGGVDGWTWNGDIACRTYLDLGAIFHIDDREGAERYARCGAIAQAKALEAIRAWAEDNAEKVDWKNGPQAKWYRGRDYGHNKWVVGATYTVQYSNLPHFTSRDDLDRCAIECAEHWDVLAEAMKEGM